MYFKRSSNAEQEVILRSYIRVAINILGVGLKEDLRERKRQEGKKETGRKESK